MDNFENETGIPCRLYVLKEWHDVLGYGEEEIQVFPSRDLARAKLKKDFCKWAHIDESEWNKAPKMFNIGKDWFNEDYVEVDNDVTGSHFFIIDEKTMTFSNPDAELIFDTVRTQKDKEAVRYYLDDFIDDMQLDISPEEQEKILEDAVGKYHANYDGSLAAYDQMNGAVEDVLKERSFIKSEKGMERYG